MPQLSLNEAEVDQFIQDIPDEVMARMTFSAPWQYDQGSDGYVDPDGASRSILIGGDKDETEATRDILQREIWNKAQQTPHCNTAVRGLAGRLAGRGFEVSCELPKIQDIIDEVTDDHRNRLFCNNYKLALRGGLEGELFLCLTCHPDGFIEVDFIDPTRIEGFSDGTGVLWHPKKANMPLIYNVKADDRVTVTDRDRLDQQIPSINIARYPDLLEVAENQFGFDRSLLAKSQRWGNRFIDLGRFNQFIVSWDKSWITRRNIGHLRTILKWSNLYENLKLWEADYKKSASAYLWVFKITDSKAFKIWLSMTDDDKRKTMMTAKKTPGASVILPPGIDLDVKYPQLPKISDEDRDILRLITAGTGEPEDIMTGAAQGPFASVKASRGPLSERTEDEQDSWEKFLRYDLWGGIFFLKNKIAGMNEFFSGKECVGFDDNQKPIFKRRKKRPEKWLEITFPMSGASEVDESRAKAYLGVKHGPMSDTLGISKGEVARRVGFSNYRKQRLDYETEKAKYPELPMTIDAESIQESSETEPARKPAAAGKKATNAKS